MLVRGPDGGRLASDSPDFVTPSGPGRRVGARPGGAAVNRGAGAPGRTLDCWVDGVGGVSVSDPEAPLPERRWTWQSVEVGEPA